MTSTTKNDASITSRATDDKVITPALLSVTLGVDAKRIRGLVRSPKATDAGAIRDMSDRDVRNTSHHYNLATAVYLATRLRATDEQLTKVRALFK